MLNHIVLFRRKVELPRDEPLEASLVDRMHALGASIEEVRAWRVSANEVDRPVCWHYVLESSFDDLDGLNAYLFHPLHQALIADLKPYFEWAVCDYSAP